MNRSLKFLMMSFSLSYLLGTSLSQAQTTNQNNTISDWQSLQGKWTLSEGGNAEIDFSQGEPVLKAFGRLYKMYNYRPQKGFSITFKPTSIQEFKNNQLPDAVRQELINKNYQQYGSVDILDSQHLSVKIFLDEATYDVEDPGDRLIGIKNVGPKQTGQFTLNRAKTVDLVGYSFWFDPENNQKIIDQIQAKESELLEVTKELDVLIAEKARYATVITKLNLDLSQAQTKLSQKISARKELPASALDKLAQLDHQILSLNNQIKDLEASLKKPQLTPEAQKILQGNIQQLQQQLVGLTQKRDLYNAHKPPSVISEDRVQLDTETADLALFIKSAKERLNGLFDEEGQTAEKIEAAYLKRSDIVHQTLPFWDDLVNHTPPFDEEIQIFLDNERVYQKNFKEDFDLASMNQALAKLEKAMEDAKENQKAWFNLANDAAQKADIAANALAGENKTYWQQYFGNGLISRTAQGNAAIDFSVDLAEMAYEGAQEGGIGGVISEGLKKVMVNSTNVLMDFLMDRTDTNFESLNSMSSDVQARIKHEFGELTNCYDPASNGGIGKAVYAAGVDHIGSKLWEILLLKGANSERFGDLIHSMVPKKLEEIEHTSHALATAERKFTNKAANGAALKNFGQEFIKNLAKIGIQKAIGLNDQEKVAWQEYINQDARGIVAFSFYQGASANYWKAQELYSQVFKAKMQALKEASHIPEGVDNRSRFTISSPIKLESGKVLGIKTTPKLPGDMEKLQLGTLSFPENLGHQYSVLISAPFIDAYNNGQLGNYGKVNLKFTKVP